MEWTLAEFGTYYFRVEWLADNLNVTIRTNVPGYVVASETDSLIWDVGPLKLSSDVSPSVFQPTTPNRLDVR